MRSGVPDPFDRLIDEVRISTIVRSDAWLKASWRNLSTPTSFLSADAEETKDGGGTPAPRADRHRGPRIGPPTLTAGSLALRFARALRISDLSFAIERLQ